MNREQIIEKWNGMTPRERDAWVAEVVFNYPNVRMFNHRYVYDNVGSLGSVMGTADVPEYTTDISAAETVLAEIPGEVYVYRKSTGEFVVSFGYVTEECPDCGDEPFEVVAQGIASTLAEAIGLAATIAKLI